MPSPLLVKARRTGREIVAVTPESAGWTYVGFRALRLDAGEVERVSTGGLELCAVILTGTVDLSVGGRTYANLGVRSSVFEEHGPGAVYVPPGLDVEIRARTHAEVALCTAPGDARHATVRAIDPATMKRSVRGKGSNTRYICDILPHNDPTAAHLLVVEVLTPAGHSSSYPPHKHDSEAPPDETQLEEIYYHRLNPPQGFAFQRVYTDDRSLDEACAVEDHDVVMVPRGYHPVVAPYGYDLYYLNVMAGPNRFWTFRNDPAHEWMLSR
jgi:5-deoxy-glucuronate isomerase